MANEEHVKLLKAGVEGWNEWREGSGEAPGLSHAHLIYTDPRDTDLIHADLVDAVLRGAVLRGTDFSDADLRDADLSGADLSSANLSHADLRDADLIHANLIGARLNDANLVGSDLSGSDLRGANLRRAHVRGATLRGSDLRGSDLSSANLRGSDLSRSDLRGAHLNAADLSGANLNDASLLGAHLNDASLVGSDLSGATLSYANLSGANLSGATLRKASLSFTVVASVDLSQVRGLEKITHDFASSVSTGTLRLTADSLTKDRANQGAVEAFLRGAGVEDEDIDHFRLKIGNPIEFYSCFISYTHIDKAFARRMYDALQGRGIRCWLDEKELRPGDHIHDSIDRGIRWGEKFIIVCSEASLGFSPWVDLETERAIQKEREAGKQKGEPVHLLIPLNLDGYLLGEHCKSAKASVLRERLAADFVGWEKDNAKFEAAFEDVVKALRTE